MTTTFPWIDEFVAERVSATILTYLEGRFGAIPPDLAEQIKSVTDQERLADLARKAASCPDLEAFRQELQR